MQTNSGQTPCSGESLDDSTQIVSIGWDEHLDVQSVALLLLRVVFSPVPGIGPKHSYEEFIGLGIPANTCVF